MELDDDFDFDESQSQSQVEIYEDLSENPAMILLQAWVNERMAPELLPYLKMEVDNLRYSMSTMREDLQELERQRQNRDNDAPVPDRDQIYIMEMDLDRSEYILTSYLRTRLAKIEKHVMYILQDADVRGNLSEAELKFATKFCDLLGEHYQNSFLHNLPEKFACLDSSEIVSKPDLNKHVAVAVMNDVGEFQVDDQGEHTVRFNTGETVVARYDAIRPLLRNQSVKLV